MMPSSLPEWLVELSLCLRSDVDAAPNGVIRFDLPKLAADWNCSHDEAERLLCAAAIGADLAVGFVDGRYYDVMTVDEAEAFLEEIAPPSAKRSGN